MTKRQPRRPNGSESEPLMIRVPVDLKAASKKRAAERGETLSAAVVEFLRAYSK
jgi:hypothetical protein